MSTESYDLFIEGPDGAFHLSPAAQLAVAEGGATANDPVAAAALLRMCGHGDLADGLERGTEA